MYIQHKYVRYEWGNARDGMTRCERVWQGPPEKSWTGGGFGGRVKFAILGNGDTVGVK